MIEVLLAAIRPKHLLAGKVIGLGLLGLGQLVIVAALGLAMAAVTGAVDVDGALVGAVALSVFWFVLGYAFYSALFAVAGAIVPRQEELQSSTTPLTMLILISLFLGFAVNGNPEGTLAHVCAFIPTTAPVTMPGRIVLGAAPAWEIAASIAVMVLSTLALIPLAGRIYAAVVLRTGSAVKLRDALRLAQKLKITALSAIRRKIVARRVVAPWTIWTHTPSARTPSRFLKTVSSPLPVAGAQALRRTPDRGIAALRGDPGPRRRVPERRGAAVRGGSGRHRAGARVRGQPDPRRTRACVRCAADRDLGEAARRHAADMVRRGYFSHVSPGGRDMGDRLRRAGYGNGDSWRAGENLAWARASGRRRRRSSTHGSRARNTNGSCSTAGSARSEWVWPAATPARPIHHSPARPTRSKWPSSAEPLEVAPCDA